MSNFADNNVRPDFDSELVEIIDYAYDGEMNSQEAYDTARLCFLDTLGCGFLALNYPECTKLLGPVVPGTWVPNGAKVPGTPYQLDPILAAFNIGTMIRWLDFNDTWLAAEWGHPSDNLGAILAISDFVSRQNIQSGQTGITIQEVLHAMIKAHEIQGCLALENSFNRVGLDHVILVKIASTAVAAKLLGLSKSQALNALSLALVDGQSLRTYRHAPNTGSRKSWAAGDATARAVQLVLMAKKGEMGYPSALTAPNWGFYDVLFKGNTFKFQRGYGTYVMENILFKLSYPAEFHAQTAVECAVKLHEAVKDKLQSIKTIHLTTHESAIRIISKKGPLNNPADRDHCLQYMVAIGLLFGDLTANHYEDNVAHNPLIDELRDKMQVKENPAFTKDYLDPNKRSIANSLLIEFENGSRTEEITIEYPIGHRRRREEGIPVLKSKFKQSLMSQFAKAKSEEIYDLCQNSDLLDNMQVNDFIDKLAK